MPLPSRRPRVVRAFVRVLPLVLAAAFAPTARAQETLTLGEAVKRALAGNVDLRRERVSVLTAEAQITSALGQFDVIFGADATFSRRTTPRLSATDLAGGYTNQLSLDASLSRALETGGNVAFTVFGNYINTTTAIQSCSTGSFTGQRGDCTYYNTTWQLQFTHPLLRNFGTEISTAQIRGARIQRDQALLNRQQRASIVLRDVIDTYWELVFASEQAAIRRSAVEASREQLRVTQAQIDVGRLSQVDAVPVQQSISDNLRLVRESEELVALRTLDLRRLFGQEPEATLEPFAPAPLGEPSGDLPDVATQTTRALAANPQLRSLQLGVKLSEIDVLVASSLLHPRLDFVGQVGTTGRALEVGDTVRGASRFDNVVWSAGLQFQAPLQNRAARGQAEAARLAGLGAQIDAQTLSLELRRQVAQLATQLKSATTRIGLARETIKWAQLNLEAEKAKFSVGRSTNNDVILRQQDLKNAQLQLVRAQIDFFKEENDLAATTGDLLERNHVTLDGI